MLQIRRVSEQKVCLERQGNAGFAVTDVLHLAIALMKFAEECCCTMQKEQEKVQKYSNNADKFGKTVKALEKSDKASKVSVHHIVNAVCTFCYAYWSQAVMNKLC